MTAGARCIRCDYDLTGLPDAGVCPECALPAMRSRSQFFAELDARTRQLIEESLTTMADCLQVQVVAVPLLLVIGIFASLVHAVLGGSVLALAAGLPGILALRMRTAQRPAVMARNQLVQDRGIAPSTTMVSAPIMIAISHFILAASCFAFATVGHSRQLWFPLLLLIVVALIGGWIAHAMYFRAIANMLSDMNESLLHAMHSQALRSWMQLWPVIWFLSLPLCFVLLGFLGYLLVMLSVAAWLQQTALRVKASEQSA